MKVTIADPLPGPLWLYPLGAGGNETLVYYHGTLPARMAGGGRRDRLTVQTTGEPFTLDLREPRPFARLRDAEQVTVYGLGTVTVISLGTLFLLCQDGADASTAATLVEGIRDAGGVVWLSAEDDLTDGSEHARRCAAIRGGQPHPAGAPAGVRYRCALFPEVASGLLASSEYIAARFRELVGCGLRTHVIQEAVDPAIATPYDRPAGRTRFVGATGGWPHLDDLTALAWPALVQASREPGTFVHLYGFHPRMFTSGRRLLDGWFEHEGVRYYHHRSTGLRAFLDQSARLDLALAPLLPTHWNRARSPVKWMEHSLRGTATISSRLEPHDRIEHGRTGLLAETAEDFIEATLLLLRDAGLRDRIARQARDEVLAHHTIAARAPAWRAWVAEATARPWSATLEP